MRIAMVGTGYVGLVSGACFSEFGFETTCVDKDAHKIARLRGGDVPIYEPDLSDMVARNAEAGRLSFTTDLAAAAAAADAVFIAVGTPSRRGDGHADLSFVFQAAREIVRAIEGYTLVVTKSTVPVGAGRKVRQVMREARPDADFDIASNPEFLREGSAVQDFMRPDRVVIGTESARAIETLRRLYRPLYLRETPIVVTSLETAEIVKYAANCFLATKITFINEIADLCEAAGADVQQVASAIGLDGRIGAKFLHAGPGYGGSCFPKDTLAFARAARDYGAPQRIVETATQVNAERKRRMAQRVIDACGGSLEGRAIACLGLTFKPNTDDMRDAPSLDIIPALQAAGARVHAHDPAGMDEARDLLPEVEFHADPYAAMQDAHCLVIITEWNAFRALDLKRARDLLAEPVLVDLRNIYDPDEVAAAGFDYVGVGRPQRRRGGVPAAVAGG